MWYATTKNKVELNQTTDFFFIVKINLKKINEECMFEMDR